MVTSSVDGLAGSTAAEDLRRILQRGRRLRASEAAVLCGLRVGTLAGGVSRRDRAGAFRVGERRTPRSRHDD